MRLIAMALAAALLISTAWAQDAQPSSNVNQIASATSSSAPPPSSSGEVYHLGAGDQLHIVVYGETDLTADYTVSPVGTIAFPLIGEVPANGLTPDQIAQAIGQRLQQGFLRHPQVSAAILSYRPFFILGEVTHPGTYPYSAALTVRGAVAVAGGFTYRANEGRVFIRHAGDQREQSYPLKADTPVQPGDTVRIGERFF